MGHRNSLPNQTVQRTGASRFARRRINRHRRLAPVADLCVSRMRFTLLLFLLIATGCASHRYGSGVVRAIRFDVDPVNHQDDEAVEQIEFTAQSASFSRIGRLPHDWSASTNLVAGFRPTCLLTCEHQYFTISDIHTFDDTVHLYVPAAQQQDLRLTARIWLNRGPTGPGRIVVLDSDQFVLR
jgi:hypothetical protein